MVSVGFVFVCLLVCLGVSVHSTVEREREGGRALSDFYYSMISWFKGGKNGMSHDRKTSKSPGAHLQLLLLCLGQML